MQVDSNSDDDADSRNAGSTKGLVHTHDQNNVPISIGITTHDRRLFDAARKRSDDPEVIPEISAAYNEIREWGFGKNKQKELNRYVAEFKLFGWNSPFFHQKISFSQQNKATEAAQTYLWGEICDKVKCPQLRQQHIDRGDIQRVTTNRGERWVIYNLSIKQINSREQSRTLKGQTAIAECDMGNCFDFINNVSQDTRSCILWYYYDC